MILAAVLLVVGAVVGFVGARLIRVQPRRHGPPAGLRGLDTPRPRPAPAGPAPTRPAAARSARPPLPRPGAALHRERPPGPPIALRGGSFTIGRRPDRDLVLDDDRVSRSHATLVSSGHGWSVRDDGSSNGTSVNGHRIAARAAVPLRDGDRLAFGGTRFVFRESGPTTAGPDATRVMPGGRPR